MVSGLKLKFLLILNTLIFVQIISSILFVSGQEPVRMLVSCHPWVSVSLEHTSWNLLNVLSISIWTEHNFLVNALIFLRGRVGWSTTSLILDDIPNFLLKNIWYIIYFKIYRYGNDPPLTTGWRAMIVLNQIWWFIHSCLVTNSDYISPSPSSLSDY